MQRALNSAAVFGLLLVYPLVAQTGQPRPLVGDLTIGYTQIVPLVVIGDGWSQRIVFLNVDPKVPVIGTLQFYTQSGQSWQVQTKDQGTASVFAVNLQPGQTAVFETVVKTSAQQLGWALLDVSLQSSPDVFGQTMFRKQTSGLPDFMCSMVLGAQTSQKLSVFFDNTNGNYTGMGIVTSNICTFGSCPPVQLKVTIAGLDGSLIGQHTISQSRGMLYWMNLATDFPETAGKIGTFVVETNPQQFALLTGVSLQFTANGAFTVITPFEQ